MQKDIAVRMPLVPFDGTYVLELNIHTPYEMISRKINVVLNTTLAAVEIVKTDAWKQKVKGVTDMDTLLNISAKYANVFQPDYVTKLTMNSEEETLRLS